MQLPLGIALARFLSHFYSSFVVQYPPFLLTHDSCLSLSWGLYVAFPSGRNVVCTPPTDTKRFKPTTQHNYPLALHGISLLTPHRYSRLSMQKAFLNFLLLQRAAVNQSSRVPIAEWSSQVARLVTKRSPVQIRLPRPNRSPNHCLSGKQKDCEGFPGRKIARLEVRTVSQQLPTGLCSTACFQKSNERSAHAS